VHSRYTAQYDDRQNNREVPNCCARQPAPHRMCRRRRRIDGVDQQTDGNGSAPLFDALRSSAHPMQTTPPGSGCAKHLACHIAGWDWSPGAHGHGDMKTFGSYAMVSRRYPAEWLFRDAKSLQVVDGTAAAESFRVKQAAW